MISIGRFAKLANVSPRTVRYYESIGLIKSASRGDNNYRYYDNHHLELVNRIRDLQSLGFSLDEVRDILKISQNDFAESLQKKLDEVTSELGSLKKRQDRLALLLSVSNKIAKGDAINDTERTQYMEAITEQIISGLKSKIEHVTPAHLEYLDRDGVFSSDPDRQAFLNAIKKCAEFAKERNLRLGPGRGSSPASLALYALGFTNFNPLSFELIPERLATQPSEIHIDVEYERGQEFVDFCREVTRTLPAGKIEAFKMPLLDIVKNVDTRLGKNIDYSAIPDDADVVLNPFRTADLEKVFQFDMSPDALIMKFEGTLSEYLGLEKIREYIGSQKIHSFRDVINITALWRLYCPEMVERVDRYRKAKTDEFQYDFLTPELQEHLKANFGVVIYHEDILRILAAYTGWDLKRCNRLRRDLFINRKGLAPEEFPDFIEFKKLAPAEVVNLFLQENSYAFCQPHAMAFAGFTKQTAILKSLHKDLYFEEIEKWEQKHGLRWDDIGVAWKGVSLLQN